MRTLVFRPDVPEDGKAVGGREPLLTDLDLQDAYRSGRDSLLDDFYIPCLEEAVIYDRAVGYFSSSLFHVVAVAYSDFVRRNGHMRLICSPALRPEDFEAMKTADEIGRFLQDQVQAEVQELLSRPETVPATRLLATLVAADIIEVRIAFAGHPSGIFHDKLGIFEDAAGRRVTFVGSANETWAAWGLNHEAFEVFRSWRDESELLRTRGHAATYQDLWRNREQGVRVETLDRVTHEELLAVADEDVDRALAAARTYRRPHGEERTLLPHQRAVVDDWVKHGNHGVVNFATGAGKTLTAIEAIRQWTANAGSAVVLVPSRDLHRQWAEEIEKTLPDCQLLLAGAGALPDTWQPLLPIFSASRRAPASQRVILVTNATFATSSFRERLRMGQHLLVVADEMHRAGSTRTIDALESVSCGATLGLSATYRRQYDMQGTERLLAFFGPILEPVVGLAEAIATGLLVPYDYRLHTLTPNEDELEQYDLLTKQIAKVVAQGDPANGASDYLQTLLIKRARLLKQARGKVPQAVELLRAEYQPEDRWLAYCDDIRQLQSLVGACLEAGLPVLEYHSAMQSDRSTVLSSLRAHGGIVVAIRCLDEGVDIPVTDHALILASSTVEREYVQRRGRVLRTAPGKLNAEIHDLLLVNEAGGALTRGEALRALEFVRLARNPGARARLRLLLALSPDPDGLPDIPIDDEVE
jgi:superfamily II DNA or RNA helicase